MIKVDGFQMTITPICNYWVDGGVVRTDVWGWKVEVKETVPTPIGNRITSWVLSMDGDEMKLTNQELCDRVRTLSKPNVTWEYR